MNGSIVLGALAIASAVLSGVAASNVADVLTAQGIEVHRAHFALWRRRAVSAYLRQYRDITTRQTGRAGAQYALYVGSMTATVLFTVGAILVRVL